MLYGRRAISLLNQKSWSVECRFDPTHTEQNQELVNMITGPYESFMQNLYNCKPANFGGHSTNNTLRLFGRDRTKQESLSCLIWYSFVQTFYHFESTNVVADHEQHISPKQISGHFEPRM